MSNLKILSGATIELPFSKTTEEITPFVRLWLQGEDKRTIDKAVRIFEMSEVNRRFSIMPIEEVFTQRSFEEKNDAYILEMKKYTAIALEKAISRAGIHNDELDAIISVSCTGFMIPSMDSFLVNELKLRRDIVRMPITEMGCAGGTSALIYAQQYLKANPGKKIALVAFESPTSTFQHKDTSMANIVSAALFSDGVAALILGDSEELRPEIVDTSMYHFYNEEDIMGFKLVNSGLQMILSVNLPNTIEEHFEQIYEPFLRRNSVNIDQIDHLIFHPGGKKIIQLVEEKFKDSRQNLDVTKEILYNYGNMSSATIFYVIERYLHRDVKAGDLGLMLSFGPGFTAQTVLVRWT